jgi:hypothetical protein
MAHRLRGGAAEGPSEPLAEDELDGFKPSSFSMFRAGESELNCLFSLLSDL